MGQDLSLKLRVNVFMPSCAYANRHDSHADHHHPRTSRGRAVRRRPVDWLLRVQRDRILTGCKAAPGATRWPLPGLAWDTSGELDQADSPRAHPGLNMARGAGGWYPA